jgi:hypothetical protein
MATGTVKWFNPTKGYGFIQSLAGAAGVTCLFTSQPLSGPVSARMLEIIEYRGFRLQVGPVGKGWRTFIYSPGSTSPLSDSPTNLEKSRKDEIVAEAKRIIDTRLKSRS